MDLTPDHARRTQHDSHMMTTDVDVRAQATTYHQVRTRHALTPAQVRTINRYALIILIMYQFHHEQVEM